MEHMKMQTSNTANENFNKLATLFPTAVTEAINANGEIVRAIDKDILMQEINGFVVEGKDERYTMNWPDKKKSIIMANSPSTNSLRPCRDESVNFDNTQNIYIEGDNLEVLKLLKENYLNRIDIIYIDPPYNTGSNLIYHNDFHQTAEEYLHQSGGYDENNNRLFINPQTNGRYHTDWLNMIYPRLKLAKQLLSKEGIIVITIDDYEIENTLKLMNEIFSEENHLGTFVIKNNPSGRSTVTGASISHEYAIFYGGSNDVCLGRLPRNEKQIARYKEEDNEGKFEWVNFRKHGGYKEDAPTMYYPIYIKKDFSSFRIPKLRWNNEKKEYDVLEDVTSDEIISYPIDENGRPRRWKWSLDRALSDTKEMTVRKDREGQPAVYIKARMKEEGMLPLTVWDGPLYSSTEYGTNLLIDLFGERYFDYPKSIHAVKDCLKIATTVKDPLILDFFSGSATTAHAVLELNAEDGGNRKFIMVQVPEKIDESSAAYKDGYKTICDIGKERIRRAGKKLIEKKHNIELFEKEKSVIDIGFRVLKLDSSNMEDIYYTPQHTDQTQLQGLIDNVKPDRTSMDLLFQVMLEYGINLSSKIECKQIDGKEVYFVEDTFLIACFDKSVNDKVVTEIANAKPQYACLRDMDSDATLTNFEQIFRALSPNTVCKVL